MIIFINGSINSGKSTVGKLLAEKLTNTALLEGDSFHAMIEWMPIEKAVPLNLKNAISTIINFAGEGLNVVVLYPLSRKNYDYVVKSLYDVKSPILFFTLAPTIEKALTNRGNRELNKWEIDRIRHHYNIGIHKPDFGVVIDNSDQTPEETANVIMDIINHD